MRLKISAFSYLELILTRERYEFDHVPLVANLLELVPVQNEEEKQIVLKAVNYYEGMTPFDVVPVSEYGNARDDWTLL